MDLLGFGNSGKYTSQHQHKSGINYGTRLGRRRNHLISILTARVLRLCPS